VLDRVQFGVGHLPSEDAAEVVRMAVLAEELGFDVFYAADSHIISREAYVLLGAIAAATHTIQIGPGVSPPQVRHPTLTASAIATLQELAPGRVRLGLGVGDSGSTNLGLRRATLRELEAAAVGLRGLLAGEAMTYQDRTFQLAYDAQPAPPIYIAGASDRTHALSGKVADGALVAGAPDDFPISLGVIREAERAAGRPPGACQPVLWTTISLDEDRAAARQAVRPVVARKAIFEFSRLARQGQLPADSPDREPFERLQAAWDSLHHMGARYADFVEERWVDRFAVAGQPDEVRARCRRAAEQGAVEVSAIFRSSGPGGVKEQLVRFAEAVIAPLRQAPEKGEKAWAGAD
jgi:5,10-methylenetetrahydromethanopterin reductase